MKKTGRNLIFIFCFLFPFLMSVAATDPTVRVDARVDRDEMGIGDSFTLSVTITANEDVNLSAPQIPNIPGLELLNSWSGGTQSQSGMSIINGQTQFTKSVSQEFDYQFSPQKEGTFLIPVLDVKVGNKIFKSNPLKIKVDETLRNAQPKKRAGPKGRPQYGDDEDNGNSLGNMPDPDDLFNQLMQQRQRLLGQMRGGGGARGGVFGNPNDAQVPNLKLDVNTNEAFFIYVELDKAEVYEGEQITANWYIYSRGQLESLDRVKFPDLKGFWKEIIEEVPSLQFSQSIVNGINYQRALLASHALFPIKAGTAVIDEFKIKGKVRLPTQFGYGQLHEWTKASRRSTLKVLPLPQEGRPQSFSGAVGTYRVSLKSDGLAFPANQPFSIKVRFEGIGNAKMIDLPAIAWPEGVEVFDTKSESKFFKDGQSYKEFEILIIPRKEGPLKIPAFQFSYFDPQQKKYISQPTEELNLTITPGGPAGALSVGTVAPSGKDAVAAAESFKPQPILELPQSSFSFSQHRILFYAVIAALMLLGFLISFFQQMRKLHQEPEFQQMVETKLRLIDIAFQKNDNRKMGSESLNLIYLLGASLAGKRRADQEWSELIKEIPIKTQNQFLVRLNQLFDYFQLLGFSPDDVVQQLVRSKPLPDQIADLKQITQEVSRKVKTDQAE
ncbi:MAG: protein BatD [Bdellovibrionaceae bacterium]|nr:protein BatD [Bdellovibrio sp.]